MLDEHEGVQFWIDLMETGYILSQESKKLGWQWSMWHYSKLHSQNKYNRWRKWIHPVKGLCFVSAPWTVNTASCTADAETILCNSPVHNKWNSLKFNLTDVSSARFSLFNTAALDTKANTRQSVCVCRRLYRPQYTLLFTCTTRMQVKRLRYVLWGCCAIGTTSKLGTMQSLD